MQGGGKGSNFLRDPSSRKTGKYKFARRLKVCRRRGGGGVIVVHRGPKGIIGPGAPYFTELVWAAPVFPDGGSHQCSLLIFVNWH